MIKKQRSLALLISALYCFTATAQDLFQKSYDLAFVEQTTAVTTLGNGHFVLAGYRQANGVAKNDIWAMRLNTKGDTIWSKTFALSQSSNATAIQITGDGNLLLCYNIGGSSPNAMSSGWMKISADGMLIWSKKAIGNSSLTNISPLASGDFLLCGQSFTGGGAQATGLVVRISADGAIQWSSVFGENGSSAVGDCWEDGLGFIHCCGYTSQASDNSNGFYAKLSAAGELIGPVRRYGSAEEDALTRIVPMGADRLLMSGYTSGFDNSAYSAVWTLIIDYSGNLKASKTFTLAENNLSTKDMIAIPGDQYLLAIGLSQGQLSPAILMKLSIDLDQLFAYQYKGGSESDVFNQVIKTSGGFAAVGNTYKNGDANAYLVATDVEGKLNNDDCCPRPLDIIRQDVVPETVAFVPTQTAFYAVQNNSFTIAAAPVSVNNLCQEIELGFSLSLDTICPGECVEIISADSTAGVQYSFEIQGGTENPDQEGQICHTEGAALFITRKGANSNCEKSLTKRVGLGAKKDEFPNAFTPNGDGANDVFRPVFGCPAIAIRFQIFNRWGKMVYETKDPTGGWDGRANGIAAASDVYAWKLEYEVENNGVREKLNERGQVTLLR